MKILDSNRLQDITSRPRPQPGSTRKALSGFISGTIAVTAITAVTSSGFNANAQESFASQNLSLRVLTSQPMTNKCISASVNIPNRTYRNIQVTLSADNPDVVFYSDQNCTAKTSSVTIRQFNDRKNFSLMATVAGTKVLTGKNPSYNNGTVSVAFFANSSPTPTPLPSATPSASPSPTASPTPTPTTTPTPSATPPPSPSATPSPTATPIVPPSATPTPTASPAPVPSMGSNPVTTAMIGSHQTYNVGPGQSYAEPDTIPWGNLQAGDVVNIFYRPGPYKWKLCLRGQGSKTNPIVINGVTDPSGNRPTFDFAGAKTASGCNPGGSNNIFTSTPAYGESLGGIVIKAGPSDPYATYKPQWIQIKNLAVGGAADGSSYTTLSGANVAYGSAAGIYVLLAADILIENCVVTNNGFGIFTMAKDSILGSAVERITVRSNRIYGNGVVGSWFEHNFYIQSVNPVIEGNYIGQVRKGSLGSSYKSRSSGEIFRFNYVEASARAVDWVHSEDSQQGIAARPDYGIDYAYGNVIVNDFTSLGDGAGAPIHYGGDNLGEDEGPGTPPVNPTQPYRRQLYFFNNTVLNRASSSQSWRLSIFDLSLVNTTVDAWNNIFALYGTANFSWLQYAGKLNLRGNNLLFGTVVPYDQADPAKYSITGAASVTVGDPLFVDLNNGNLQLNPNSPAIDKSTAVPPGLPATLTTLTLDYQPSPKANGLIARPVVGSASDLGATEKQ